MMIITLMSVLMVLFYKGIIKRVADNIILSGVSIATTLFFTFILVPFKRRWVQDECFQHCDLLHVSQSINYLVSAVHCCCC